MVVVQKKRDTRQVMKLRLISRSSWTLTWAINIDLSNRGLLRESGYFAIFRLSKIDGRLVV